MGNDPGNVVDPTGGFTDPVATLANVDVVAKARTGVKALGLGQKVLSTTTTTLTAVNVSFKIFQNKKGEQFETRNLGLKDKISDDYGQDWSIVEQGSRTVYVEEPTTDILSSGEWQQRLSYYYNASHSMPSGSTEDDWWGNAEQTWNGAHSVPYGNIKYTNNSFWTGGREELSVAPTAIEPTDGPETLIGGGMVGVGRGLLIRNGSKNLIKNRLQSKYDDLVSEATKRYGGNVTVQRKGKDLFRVHQSSSGHGYKVDQLDRVRQTPIGLFKGKQKVPIRKKHIKQLERALKGDPNYNLRTSSGK
jgi:hypothetical protein